MGTVLIRSEMIVCYTCYFMSGDKAGAGCYNRVGHVDVATAMQTAVTHVDGHTAVILTQWTTSAVSVT